MAETRSTRTGDWLGAEGTFLPKPPKGTVRFRPETDLLLAETQAAAARLDEAAHRSSAGPALVAATRALDLQGAAELRGVFVALREIFLVDVPSPTGPVIDERLRRRWDGYRTAVTFVRSGRDVDLALLDDVSAIASGTPAATAARWRDRPRWLDGPDPTGRIAVPSGRRMLTRTRQCLAWLDSHPTMPLMARLGIGHAQLAILDAREDLDYLPELVVLLHLIRQRVLRDQILPLSNWLTGQRDTYQISLLEYAQGNIDDWVIFFAEGIRQACRDQMVLISELEEIRDRQLSRFTREDKFLDAVGGLIGHPVTNRHLIAKLLEISLDHAGSLVDRLKEEGLAEELDPSAKLRKVDGKRYASVVFSREILSLLSRHLPPPPAEDRGVPK